MEEYSTTFTEYLTEIANDLSDFEPAASCFIAEGFSMVGGSYYDFNIETNDVKALVAMLGRICIIKQEIINRISDLESA